MVHVDFHQISLTKKIRVTVPLSFQGEAPGVKQQGGVLEHLRWDLEVECLPTEIPAQIPVDLSGLELGKTLHVSDLILPADVRTVSDPEHPVISCAEPRSEEAPAAAEAGVEPAEPEVIKQKKPEEGAAEAAGDEKKEKPKEKQEKKAEKPG